jgi:hypothetical protein
VLFRKRFLKLLLILVDELLVSFVIEEDRRALLRQALQLREHVEVNAMRAKEDVARKCVERGEGMLEIGGDAGVGCWMAGLIDEVVLGPERGAADDDHITKLGGWVAGEMCAERPRGATARVACGFVGDECEAA